MICRILLIRSSSTNEDGPKLKRKDRKEDQNHSRDLSVQCCGDHIRDGRAMTELV